MIKNIYFIVVVYFLSGCNTHPTFEQMANEMAGVDFPVIHQDSLRDSILFLDCRTKEEFNVSHIPGAIWIGENYHPALPLDSGSSIVVYCSVGYRSRIVGEELQENGFKKVFNLWGGIFHWSNEGRSLVDTNGKATHKVHAYNRKWSKWLKTEEKIYD